MSLPLQPGYCSNNKTCWTCKEIIEITNGKASTSEVQLNDDWLITGASVYSFQVQPGDLFILLSHHRTRVDFVQEAFERGASATLLTQLNKNDGDEINKIWDQLSKLNLQKCIFVEDSNQALITLGTHASRTNTACTKIAITGSVGKTSTKEGLAQILSAVLPPPTNNIHYNYMNFNNEIGVSLSLVRMPRNGHVDYAIFELGMSNPNEIARLTKMVQPSIVVITEITEAHLEFFGSIEEIIDAKCEIFEASSASNKVTAILNRDLLQYVRVEEHAARNKISDIITFGQHPDSTFHLRKFTLNSGSSNIDEMKFGDKLYSYSIGQPGKSWVWNSLAILTTIHCLRPSCLELAMKELANLAGVAGRGVETICQILGPGPQGEIITIKVIDDSYNASPSSMKIGLERLGLSTFYDNQTNQSSSSRKIAVLGDMKELGEENELQLHLSLKPILESNHVDLLFVCGPLMKKLFDSMGSHLQGGCADSGNLAGNSEELIPKLKEVVRNGDIIYVKGSRSMKMELIVNSFARNQL